MKPSVSPYPRPALLSGFALLAAVVGAFPASGAPEAAPGKAPWQHEAWRQAASLLVDDALGKLPAQRAIHDPAERRTLDFTRAILLLNAQPKLQRNIDEARTLLESVQQARGDDDLGLSAMYYLGRIAEFHADPHDSAKAAAWYNALIARAPAHPLAQQAVSRLAVLQLYEDVTPEERRARLERFEAAVGQMNLPSARRDLHFVLASAVGLFNDDQEGVLRHLLAAEEAGIVRSQLAGETLVRIALLARQLGHRDVAIAHYRKFLTLFQRDSRAYLLATQLRELEAEASPTPAASPSPPPPAPNASPTP